MRTRQMAPLMDIDTTLIYSRMNARRRAYQRERLLKNVCPWIIAAACFGTLIVVVVRELIK